MKKHPIYNIDHFKADLGKKELYINTFKNHLKAHSFIEKPHRHNFYLLVLFTNGSGTHEIDFTRYDIKPGSLFVLQPGQIHHWQLSEDIEGYIFFYAQEIYNLYFGNKKIEDYPFYQSVMNQPEIVFEIGELASILPYFDLMIAESQNNNQRKEDKLLNLLDSIHIEISRKYLSTANHKSHSYNYKIHQLEQLLEQHFKTEKSPSFYADKMSITLKHLNRICKDILNQTVTELITNRVILEAKRLLTNASKTINQVADILGFENYSYFTRLFKKQTGMTPSEFRKKLN
ncbi:helix-turn-helix domain-containing protein [Flavobacterium sp. J49]|uniref:AraC family transcriptional regulator n=1 Tax=Flavobacterium sp. J49 TaxID=2718534 RepID=UPI001594A4C7|nr:helix-turn-helix domain-containing protein [Flavobacterium sp. J49]MBF6640689.1 helix-turn-helix domain-containing protein [Flavobacterium sp. J49]NIC01936.1 helix-turn-helix domain-containing protein [Flavobacterium sp. J49]